MSDRTEFHRVSLRLALKEVDVKPWDDVGIDGLVIQLKSELIRQYIVGKQTSYKIPFCMDGDLWKWTVEKSREIATRIMLEAVDAMVNR